jgi:hypothetical protein
MVITVIMRVFRWNLLYSVRRHTHHSSRILSILSYHLHLGVQNGISVRVLWLKYCVRFSYLHSFCVPCQSHYTWLYHPDYNWYRVQSEPGRVVGKHGSCLGHSRGGGGAVTNNNIFNISELLTLWNIFL